jgi:serine/threonine protein kinase
MVAVKTPLPSVLATEDGRARFQREAESWIALGVHPNICSAYYLQEIGGMPRLFIEYVDGGDLSDWLRQEERPSLEQRFDVAIQIASGLDYTHNFLWTDDDGVEHTGVVHRDIKPANVLLTTDGIARVTDFGLVRAEGGDEVARDDDVRQQVAPALLHTGRREDASMASGSWQTVTVDGGLVGTPPYMAPELWKQSLRGTIATDMYAYGCMLYEIFCGRRPFMMPTDAVSRTREAQLSGWMRLHLREDPPDPLVFEPGLEQRLAALMRACVAKDPKGRPQSFSLLRGWMVEMYREATGRPYPRPEPQRTQLLADSLNNRGVSFITLGLEERAAGSFRDALDADPRHLEATFNSGLLEWRRDGLTDAELERRLSEAERTLGDRSRSGLLRARLRLLLDDPEGAVKALDPAGEIIEDTHAARRERGLALLGLARRGGRADDLERARELLSTVMEASPSDVAVVVGLAEIFARLGNKDVTKEAMTRARALDPEIVDSLPEAVATHLPGHWLTRSMSHHAPVQSLLSLPNGWLVVRSVAGDASVWEATGPPGPLDDGDRRRSGGVPGELTADPLRPRQRPAAAEPPNPPWCRDLCRSRTRRTHGRERWFRPQPQVVFLRGRGSSRRAPTGLSAYGISTRNGVSRSSRDIAVRFAISPSPGTGGSRCRPARTGRSASGILPRATTSAS